MEKTKRLTTLALLSALALGIYIAESQLPPLIPVQGVKPGLANIITLTAMFLQRSTYLVFPRNSFTCARVGNPSISPRTIVAMAPMTFANFAAPSVPSPRR